MQGVEERDDPAHLTVHPRDHRGVGGERSPTGHVALAAEIGLLGTEVLIVGRQRRLVGGHLQRQVRHRRRHIDEKRPAGVVLDKRQLPLGDQVG